MQQSKRSASLSPRCQMQLWNSLHYRPHSMYQEMSLRLPDPLPAFRENLEMRLMMEWMLAPGFHDLPVYSSLSMRRECLCCSYSSSTLHGFYLPFEQGGNSTKTYSCQNYETHHVVVNSSTQCIAWFPLDFVSEKINRKLIVVNTMNSWHSVWLPFIFWWLLIRRQIVFQNVRLERGHPGTW